MMVLALSFTSSYYTNQISDQWYFRTRAQYLLGHLSMAVQLIRV